MEEESGISVLDVLVTSSINSFGTQRRFQTNLTVRQLKEKLELITGASSSTMELQLLNEKKELMAELTANDSTLSSYSLGNAKMLHVIDPFHQAREFEDVSKVKKFELSEEEYFKRGDTLRAFKEKLKLQGGDSKTIDEEKKMKEEEAAIKNIVVGRRCEVFVLGKPKRRGTVMYVGKTDFKPGFWVGVKYDESLGKNDGSVGGRRYFSCEAKYGGFVKPHDVDMNVSEEVDDLDEI